MKYISDNLSQVEKVALIRKQMSYPDFLKFRRCFRWYRDKSGRVIIYWS